MKVIITGATGFVGQNLVKELAAQNAEVTALVRDRDRIPQDWRLCRNIHCFECGMGEYLTASDTVLKDVRGDIFIHLAWAGTSGMQRADYGLQLSNIRAACDAVWLAGKLDCTRFINAGSIMEYEAGQYLSADDAEPGGGYIYSTAKLAADYMAKCVAGQINLSYINIIISNIYGAGETSERFLVSTVRKLLKNEPIPLTEGRQLYDFIYVTDAVKAVAAIANAGKASGSYYIGNSVPYPLREFLLRMKQTLASSSVLDFGSVPFKGPMLSYKEFDTARLERELGFVPEISFEKGIILLKEWLTGKCPAEKACCPAEREDLADE